MSTASTSALSSVLSALNNGSAGIDVTSAVASTIAADRAPETAWEAQQATLNSQASAIQQLESDASAVTVSLQSLNDAVGAFSTVAAASSNTTVLNASAEAGTATGTHSIVVSSLATSGSWYSDEESSSSVTLPSGSFSITANGTPVTFTTGSGSGNDTLTQLASAINNASIGVNATVVHDANGARLALVSQNSGAAADFSISSDTGLQLTRATTGQNASLTVDGAPVSSATNTVTGAITGLTLNLTGINEITSPVTVSLSPDVSTIVSTLSSFVSTYNTLVKDLNTQFTYSSSTGSEGVLSSDSAARSMQSDVLAAANLNIGSGNNTTLTSLGITTNQDGTLTLNASTLGTTLGNNYQGVVAFFQGSNSNAGFATTFLNTLDTYTDPSQGAFTVDLQSISNEYQDLSSEISTFEVHIAAQQILLTTEYNNANIALQQLPEQIKQVQALLGETTSSNS